MLLRLARWLRTRRIIRRCLYGSVGVVSLVILFYAEEDWRGKRDWEQYKREWEAKGERFDFASFVPPAVPDDQNFALTPIVASAYGAFLDRHGHCINPPNTNVVDRLDFRLNSPPEWKPWPTNDFQGNWQLGMKADLKVFQAYYRAPVNTDTNWPGWYRRAGIPNLRLNATNDFPIARQPQSPAADVLLALSKYDAAIEELRQATHLPHSRFPLNFDAQPIMTEIRLPALAPLQQCAQVLRLRAIAELENGQNEKALDDVKLILYLANSLRAEPLLTSQSSRATIVNSALQPLWEGLADREWSDAQLAVIVQELAQFDFLSDYQFAVRSERAQALDWLDYTERKRNFYEVCAAFFSNPDEIDNVSAWDHARAVITVYLPPKGWFYQNDLFLARVYQESLPTDDQVRHRMLHRETAERVEKAMSINLEHPSLRNSFALMLSGGVPRWSQKFAFAQSCLDRALVACALERYRLAHGEYPATLDLLSPQFIDRLPLDIINGQPLRYRRTDDGQFLLYSVGWNGADDGGIVVGLKLGPWYESRLDMEKGDWVWPCQPLPIPPSPHHGSLGHFQPRR